MVSYYLRDPFSKRQRIGAQFARLGNVGGVDIVFATFLLTVVLMLVISFVGAITSAHPWILLFAGLGLLLPLVWFVAWVRPHPNVVFTWRDADALDSWKNLTLENKKELLPVYNSLFQLHDFDRRGGQVDLGEISKRGQLITDAYKEQLALEMLMLTCPVLDDLEYAENHVNSMRETRKKMEELSS